MDLFPHKLTYSGLQGRDTSSKRARDIWRGTKLPSFRAKAGGGWVMAPLSRDGSASKYQCSFVEYSSHLGSSVSVSTKSVFSINLANTILPDLVILRGPAPSTHTTCEAPSRGYFTQAACLGLHYRLRQNLSKGHKPPNKQWLASVCPVSLAEYPKPIITSSGWPQLAWWSQDWHSWLPALVHSNRLSQVSATPAQVANNCRSLCSFHQAVPG